MAMRITNKMMQNTAMRNLNTNKAREQKLTNQMATGKKIDRPSDDPVIAIRALKLNASLDKIDQFYEKNSEDAQHWLDLTASAIDQVQMILEDEGGIKQNITQMINGYETDKDRLAVIENIVNQVKEFYSTGNASSAGRSLFTGYRTDLPLAFTEDKEETYYIMEQLTNSALSTMTFVKTGDLPDINDGNFNRRDNTTGAYTQTTTEYDVDTYEIARIRLAYKNTDALKQKLDTNGNPVFAYADMAGNALTPPMPIYEPDITLSFGGSTYSANPTYDASGNYDGKTILVYPSDRFNTIEDAYMEAVKDPDAIVYIADTGEILLGENKQQEIAELKDDEEIRIGYEKTHWEEGNLDPIHYFYTERTQPNTGKKLVYNAQYLQDKLVPDDRQIIEYDIGNNQTIRVNTTPDELFTHDIGRDVDDLVNMLEDYGVIKDNYTTIDKMIESGEYYGDDLDKLNEQRNALKKAQELLGDKIQKRAEEMETKCDKYIERTTLAETNCGSRGNRLKIIKNRLSVQQENFQELVSENEDADYDELTIQLKSVQLSYQAALSSIAYVLQNSLLDFIR